MWRFSRQGAPWSVQGEGGVLSGRNLSSFAQGEGGGAAMPEEGLEVRDGEAVARPAVCTAEVMERLQILARTSVVAARMLANEERNRRLSRGGAAP